MNTRKVISIVESNYKIAVRSVTPLVGYDNLNFLITDKNGQKFVYKLLDAPHGKKNLIQTQCKIIEILSKKYPNAYPVPARNNRGQFITEDKTSLIWILRWVEGEFLHEIKHTPELFQSFGRFLAKTNKVLYGFSDPVIEARRYEWDLQLFLGLKSKSIADPSIRKLVEYYFIQFKEFVLPELPGLRKSIIHNDANDWNVLTQDGKVSGLIDFGDMVHGPLIQELAVALTYAMMNKDEPLEWATYILRSYHEIIPLEEKEVDLLYYLIAARLCLSLIHSFYAVKEGIADDYTLVSQKAANDLLQKWIAISPDKASIVFRTSLGINVPEKTDYKKEIKKRYQHIGHALSVSYQHPIKMKRAAFQYMFDADGNTFLDAYNNIPHVGHQHPRIVEAGQRQMALLNTNTRYLYDQLAEYAERLLAKFPTQLSKVFFVNSGSEASDLAIRMAQTHSGNQKVAVIEHGYHGNTNMGINISHYKLYGKGGTGAKDFISVLPLPDTYRGLYQKNDGSAGKSYSMDSLELLDTAGQPLAAFIAEPIVGCGGQVPLAKDYLKNLYPEIRKRGGLCISDEVQTGFGRLGSHFWGFEMHEVVPDIVVLGKPMGNGHPIGAVVTTDEIAKSFDKGMEFFSSFGGNPVSCAIGMAVLDVIAEEGLQQNALENGTYFIEQLKILQKEFPLIGDVRGSGLFIGIEFIKDTETKEHNTVLAQFLKNKLRQNFVLVSTDGPFDNVIKMKPPLCFGKCDVDMVIKNLRILLS